MIRLHVRQHRILIINDINETKETNYELTLPRLKTFGKVDSEQYVDGRLYPRKDLSLDCINVKSLRVA